MPKSRWSDVLPATGQAERDPLQELAVAGAGSTGSMSKTSASAAADLFGTQQASSSATEQLSSLSTQLNNLASAQQAQTAAIEGNTQAVTQNTSEKGGSGSSLVNTAEGVASSALGGGFALSPIIGGLMSLFGGGSSEATSAPTSFQLPPTVNYQEGLSGGATSGIVPVNYGATGQPRPQSGAATPQVNIQVTAMDSQSFLDHSDDIANAVKQALLSSHSLSDVITEL